MLKKVAKALDEMAKNEELMEGILSAAMGMDGEDEEGGRVGGGEIEQPDHQQMDGGDDEEGGGNQRLGTIGEDGDEDKQIYDTNTGGIKGKTPGTSAAALQAEKSGEGQYEEDYEF
jgi:hypothetical protein